MTDSSYSCGEIQGTGCGGRGRVRRGWPAREVHRAAVARPSGGVLTGGGPSARAESRSRESGLAPRRSRVVRGVRPRSRESRRWRGARSPPRERTVCPDGSRKRWTKATAPLEGLPDAQPTDYAPLEREERTHEDAEHLGEKPHVTRQEKAHLHRQGEGPLAVGSLGEDALGQPPALPPRGHPSWGPRKSTVAMPVFVKERCAAPHAYTESRHALSRRAPPPVPQRRERGKSCPASPTLRPRDGGHTRGAAQGHGRYRATAGRRKANRPLPTPPGHRGGWHGGREARTWIGNGPLGPGFCLSSQRRGMDGSR